MHWLHRYSGSEFQSVGPAEAKAREPDVLLQTLVVFQRSSSASSVHPQHILPTCADQPPTPWPGDRNQDQDHGSRIRSGALSNVILSSLSKNLFNQKISLKSVHYLSELPRYNRHTRTSYRRAAPRYAPAQACKWWHDVRHVRIWTGHHYCMSMLACQYNQPKRPGDLDIWPFNLESGVRITCDVGYSFVPILVFLGLSVLELGPMYTTDRQTSDKHRFMPRLLGARA